MRPLKKWVSQKLNDRSILRTILLEEKDEISVAEFTARLPVYLALLRRSEEW